LLHTVTFTYKLTPASIILWILALSSYYLAKHLSPVVGWENGFLENTQVVVLFMGMLLCLSASPSPIRKQARVIAALFLLMIGRELSWGRVFFPTGVIDEMGPNFVPMSEIPLHQLIHAGIFVYVVILIYLFVHIFNWYYFLKIPIPVPPLIFMLVCTIFQRLAEHLLIPGLMPPQMQTMEEFLELCIYMQCLGLCWYYGLTRLSLGNYHLPPTSCKKQVPV
jgi:hypothetical protein